MPTTLRSTTHTAKKEHHCDYCLQKISIGEEYGYAAMVYCGDFYTWKNHIKCEWIAHQLNMFDEAYEGVNDEMFCEEITNEYSNLMDKHFNVICESKNYEVPNFKDQLDFVIKFHSDRDQ